MSIDIFDCLIRERDICVKATISSQNTAFGCTPALSLLLHEEHFCVYLFLSLFVFREKSNSRLLAVSCYTQS